MRQEYINLLMEAMALKAGPIPKSVAHILFSKDSSLFGDSTIFLAFAFAFAVVNPSTAWSHSSGEASFTCLDAFSLLWLLPLWVSGWPAVAIEACRTNSDILVTLKEEARSFLSSMWSNVETPCGKCLKNCCIAKVDDWCLLLSSLRSV